MTITVKELLEDAVPAANSTANVASSSKKMKDKPVKRTKTCGCEKDCDCE